MKECSSSKNKTDFVHLCRLRDQNSDCPPDEKRQLADRCLVLRECPHRRSPEYSNLPASSIPTGRGLCFAESECYCSSTKPPPAPARLLRLRPKRWERPQLLFFRVDRASKKGNRCLIPLIPCAPWERTSSSCVIQTLVRPI